MISESEVPYRRREQAEDKARYIVTAARKGERVFMLLEDEDHLEVMKEAINDLLEPDEDLSLLIKLRVGMPQTRQGKRGADKPKYPYQEQTR